MPRWRTLLLPLLLAGCADEAGLPTSPESTEVPQAARPDIPSRSEQRPGTWLERSDEALWQEISASGGLAAVGLKSPGAVRGVYRGQILLPVAERPRVRQAVLAQRGVSLVHEDDLLPVLEVRLESLQALQAVRRLGVVDYLEPVRPVQEPAFSFASTGGCGYGSSWAGDRQQTSLGDLYSERWSAQNLPAAWKLSGGAGVTIGLTDTGISRSQGQLNAQFATGSSTRRTLKLLHLSHLGNPYDECGHGTQMAGILAAPQDGGSTLGVAWKANLVSVRQANGVAAVSSSDAKYSVRMAARNGSRIITMAWQSLNWFWQVSDEIEYWHYRYPILFIGAAGTSGCGDGILDSNVVFPADMKEVMAVTGVSYPDGGLPCGIHYGPDVEVTSYLLLPTTGQYTADITRFGGSSSATAVVSGIAALVWSHNPRISRDELRLRLQRAGASYPVRDDRTGYGVVDAAKAVDRRLWR